MTDERYVCAFARESRIRLMLSLRTIPSQVVPADYPSLETLAKDVVKDKQKFERLVVSKENLLKMFEVIPRRRKFVSEEHD